MPMPLAAFGQLALCHWRGEGGLVGGDGLAHALGWGYELGYGLAWRAWRAWRDGVCRLCFWVGFVRPELACGFACGFA